MAQPDPLPPALTPYERATCYYTLPRIARPMHGGLVLGFGAILLVELIALSLVAVDGARTATMGMVLLVVVTALAGTAYMMVRSLLSEIRVRRVLRDAREAPPTRTEDDTLPDPFAGHLLLRHPGNAVEKLTACTDHDQEIAYTLHAGGHTWNLRSASDEPVLVVRSTANVGSFRLLPLQPKRLTVFKEDEEIARIHEAGSLLNPYTQIDLLAPAPRIYKVQDGGILFNDRVIGRTYFVRDAWYLDIEKPHVNEGTLGYFVSLV